MKPIMPRAPQFPSADVSEPSEGEAVDPVPPDMPSKEASAWSPFATLRQIERELKDATHASWLVDGSNDPLAAEQVRDIVGKHLATLPRPTALEVRDLFARLPDVSDMFRHDYGVSKNDLLSALDVCIAKMPNAGAVTSLAGASLTFHNLRKQR